MILWTPVAPEEIFSKDYEPKDIKAYSEMEIDGITVQVSMAGSNQVKIERIISTDPQAFLREDLSPGRLVTLVPLLQ